MNSATYCKTLRAVSKAELINALHQSLLQLAAVQKHENLTLMDNRPAIAESTRIMKKAGHVGYCG